MYHISSGYSTVFCYKYLILPRPLGEGYSHVAQRLPASGGVE